MSLYTMVMDLQFNVHGPNTDEAFDDFTDRVMDALLDLEMPETGISSADLTASITNRAVSICMGIEADTEPDAVKLFASNVRTALHAAGCNTPQWPDFRVPDDLPEPHALTAA